MPVVPDLVLTWELCVVIGVVVAAVTVVISMVIHKLLGKIRVIEGSKRTMSEFLKEKTPIITLLESNRAWNSVKDVIHALDRFTLLLTAHRDMLDSVVGKISAGEDAKSTNYLLDFASKVIEVARLAFKPLEGWNASLGNQGFGQQFASIKQWMQSCEERFTACKIAHLKHEQIESGKAAGTTIPQPRSRNAMEGVASRN